MSTLTSAQNKKPMESLTIDEWVKQLGGIPEKDFTIPQCAGIHPAESHPA